MSQDRLRHPFRAVVIAAVAGAATVVGVAACSSTAQNATVSAGPTTTSSTTDPIACPPASLGIRLGPKVSPQTGEEGMIVAVRSSSATQCTINGYPKITFVHGSRPIPFTYLDGEGQYVTHRKPAAVTVGAGKSAYFLVAKYRCDVGIGEVADGANVVLPGQGAIESVPRTWLRGAFTLCSGETAAGRSITVSPLEPDISLLS